MRFGTTKLELRLPPNTEEWAEEMIEGKPDEESFGKCERTPDALIVRHEVGGNCSPLTNAGSWLSELHEWLQGGEVEPPSFTLTTTWEPEQDTQRGRP